MMLKQKPSFCNGSQKHHSDPKEHGKFRPMCKWWWLCFLYWQNSSQISTLWPDSEYGILCVGDQKAERGSKEEKGLICGWEKIVAPL